MNQGLQIYPGDWTVGLALVCWMLILTIVVVVWVKREW